MYLNTAQPILATCNRVLMVSEERTLKDDICLALSLQNMDHSGVTSAPQSDSRQHGKSKPPQPLPEITCVAHEKEALALVEAAARQHQPYSLVIIDGRLSHGKDHRQIIRHFWQVQRDLQVVMHAVSQLEAFEQIPLDLGSPSQLLVLKFRLMPFEITQLIRTLTAKHLAESKSSHRDLSLNTQILEAARRFEDVSNRLRNEQEHRLRLEEKLCKAQRLETMGRLADGIAHFFNNSLTVIQGHLGVALSAKECSPHLIACLGELQEATHRAASLTTQMVTFNHREFLQPGPVRELAYELSSSDRFSEFRDFFRMPLSKVENIADLLIRRGHVRMPRSLSRRYEFNERIMMLVMSALHILGTGATFRCCRTLTHISTSEVRKFFMSFLDAFVEMKDEFIFLPNNVTALKRTMKSYESV